MSEAFMVVVQLGLALGKRDMSKLPGCWEHQVDEQWWIALNPHDGNEKCSTGAAVPGFSIYIRFNEWPAGLIDPRSGVIAAGAAANEDSFIAAVQAATAKAEAR